MWLLMVFPILTGAVGINEDCGNVTLCGHLPWSEWSACSETCGGGYQTRKRKICGLEKWDEEALKENCGNPHRIDIKICNMNCLNNGSFVNGKCICTPRSGKTGRCCEKELLSLENLMTSKEIASTFIRNRAPRTKRENRIYEECQELESCYYEEVKEWIKFKNDGRGVCEWMKDKRCGERVCSAGYTCVTIVRNCDRLRNYEVGCLDKDECASNPCMHGGTCYNLLNRFNCSCHDGYQGPRCQHEIDECASNPCKNGGTCHDLVNKFTCSCIEGYYGSRCEHECRRPDYCDEYKCTTKVDSMCIKCYGQGKTPEDSIYFTSSDLKTCTDQSPPKFTNCPSEMVQKYDSGKGSYVNWEPIHVEEYIGNFSLSSNVQNGAFFSFGDHPVVYNAIDNSGNANNCTFTVRVIEIQDKACLAPPVPFHGFLGCQNKGALQCSIHSCDEGYLLKNNDSHTCENGVWNPEFPKDFIATSCIKPEPTYLRRNYTFTFNCTHLSINAAELKDCINQSGLCPEGDIILCDWPFQRIEGQQLSSKILQIWMIMEGKLSFDTNKQLLMQQMDDHGQKVADLFQTGMFLSTCSNLTCDFGEMSAGQISEVCTVGSTFYQINGDLVCAKCGPGWLYAENTCIQCPEGFYQDIAGQQDCKECPDERTSTIGAFSISQCFAKQESRELLSPFDTTTVVGVAVGGLVVLVLLLIVLIVMIQWRRSSLESPTSANKSHYPNPVYEESEKKVIT